MILAKKDNPQLVICPAFSVITVVYEIDEDFWVTAQNLAEQKNAEYEWIIKPATAVSDKAKTRLNALSINYKIVNTQDSGIYSAMNIAVAASNGEYIFFLNSGDRFADANTLHRVWASIVATRKPNLVYGKVRVGGIEHIYPERLNQFYFFRNALCHQAYFISRNLCDAMHTFDESFRVLADHEFALRHLKAILDSHHRLDISVADVPEMGFSARNAGQKRQERRRLLSKYFPIRRYLGFHVCYAATLPGLRAWLFRFPLYRELRGRLLRY